VAKDRPTILQIIPQLDAGGAELSVVEIAGGVARAGGRSIVLAEPGRLAANIVAAGAEVHPFPAGTKNPLRMLANGRQIARIAAREGVDLIHARSRAPAWSALMAARRLRVPFVTTYHGAYNETNVLKRLYNSVMARGDLVIANSNYTAGLIATRYGTPAERVEVIHRGVDIATFDPGRITPERLAALRQSWGVAPHQRVILQAARLTRWKGQGVLLDAAARLAAHGRLQDVAVVLAGDAQGRTGYVEELRDRIVRQGLGAHVHTVGHVEDMAAAYLAAHVTVIASTEPEAFGRTAIEAAALGCPVIATDIGAPPETVLAEGRGQPPGQPPCIEPRQSETGALTPPGGPTGWLVPPEDAEALAERLVEALALSPPARAAMGERARRHALANFSVISMQRSTLGVYDRLLGTTMQARFDEVSRKLSLDSSVSVSLQRS
jgi:glycosyltransferase involved in cell wall biosynthesis